MLMVIFGAGASYDSARAFPPPVPQGATQNFGSQPPAQDDGEAWRPPLASELFRDAKQRFGDIVTRYGRLHPILLRLREPQNGRSLEEELQCLQGEAVGNPERLRQLLAVRYYLRDLLSEVTENWLKRTRFTNYAQLIDQIMQFRRGDEPVCLVTFNYDRLLDHALLSFGYKSVPIERFFDAHPVLKLFKPHGSVDWARFVDVPPNTRIGIQELIERADSIKFTDDYLVANATDPHQVFAFDRPIVPAIAIPVQTKTEDTFEWPRSHRVYLEELLPSVTKIMIIGWQAREAHFLQILRSTLPRRGLTHLLVVGRNEQNAASILQYFSAELGYFPANHSFAREGFSEFVVGSEAEAFFRA
jgi:SIR2-like domain